VAGKFVHPHDACFDKDGNIYVVEWVSTGRGFRDMGCTHLEINTMGAGYADLGAHLKTLERFRRDATALFTASSR